MQNESFEEALKKTGKVLDVIKNTNYEPDVLIKEGNRTYAVRHSEKQQLEKYRFRLDLFCLSVIGALFILMLLAWLI